MSNFSASGLATSSKSAADVGERLPDGTYSKNVNDGRTSTNAWCLGECYSDPIARRIMDRIENVTGIPERNSENLQLLRYKHSEFYQTHNDFIPYQVDRQCGVRILTFYMYLSDVEEGGGTNFPVLGKTIDPEARTCGPVALCVGFGSQRGRCSHESSSSTGDQRREIWSQCLDTSTGFQGPEHSCLHVDGCPPTINR